YDLSAQQVLLHEYSHHFMFSNYDRAFPMWFMEGFAEFNANVKFEDDGSIHLGLPASYRAYALFVGQPLPMRELFDPRPRDFSDPDKVDVIYGRAWLLMHYLMIDPERQKQLNSYLNLLNEGKSSVDAATIAFGDIPKLGHTLENYLDTNRFHEIRLKPSP